MIVNVDTMKTLESNSGISSLELMEKVGILLCEEIKKHLSKKDKILLLVGKGNNGGDALVLARLLSEDYECKVCLVEEEVKTEEAKKNLKKVKKEIIIDNKDIGKEIDAATVIIDGVYGFSYHGDLNHSVKTIFDLVNKSNAKVYSIDINSGAEADTAFHSPSTIISDITYVLDAYKPVHKLRKEHHLFKETVLIPLDLPHDIYTNYLEMNEDFFFQNFPKKNESDYKGTYGKSLIAGGCFGMAGALSLNITGARSVGASYIDVALPESIYPIVAGKHTTAIYHPFGVHTSEEVIEPLIKQSKAILFGSGAVRMDRKLQCMDLILQESEVPVVLDAEALRLLHQNTYILQFVKCPLILTPHISEFAGMVNTDMHTINDHRLEYATKFAKEHGLYLVLKGSNTIVASPKGEIYINEAGNQALAQAGSGDLLAGIILAMLTFVHDIFKATSMAVWLHGHLADLGIQKHSKQVFSLESFPEIADEFFKTNGY